MEKYIWKNCTKINQLKSKAEKRQAFQQLRKAVEDSNDSDKNYLLMLIKEYEETRISDCELASLLERLKLISK